MTPLQAAARLAKTCPVHEHRCEDDKPHRRTDALYIAGHTYSGIYDAADKLDTSPRQIRNMIEAEVAVWI